MLIVVCKLVVCALLLVPMVLAAWAFVWKQSRGKDGGGGGWTECESLLAALVGVAVLVVILVAGLGSVPWVERPLDGLWFAQGMLTLWSVRVVVREGAVLRALARELWAKFLVGRRESMVVQRLVVVVGVLATLATQAFATWTTPWTYDTLMYHIPQMMQPVQDGRLGPIHANTVWTDSYPRGAALLYGWGMLLVHTDAVVHATSGVFMWVLMLAIVVACRRLGLGRGWSLTAAASTATTPIVLLEGMSGYIDLIVGGLLAAGLAFALPRQGGTAAEEHSYRAMRWGRSDALGMLAAIVLAIWCKIVPVCLGGVVLAWSVAWRTMVAMSRERREAARRRGDVRLGWLLVAVTIGLALAFVPYGITWWRYGSPTWPMELKLGSVVIFEGVMGVHWFGRFNDQGLVTRFVAMWGNFWHTPQIIDSPGGFGPLFGLLGVWACVITMVAMHGPRREKGVWKKPAVMAAGGVGWSLLLAVLVANAGAPEHHVPRYTIVTLVVVAASVALVGQALSRPGRGVVRGILRGFLGLAVLGLACWNVERVARTQWDGIKWIRTLNMPTFGPARGRAIIPQVSRSSPDGPTPETMKKLRELQRPGELTVVAVSQPYFALYWNDEYTNRVEHHDCDSTLAEIYVARHMGLPQELGVPWLARLPRDTKLVMVYKESPEDAAIARSPNFAMVYEQPAESGGVQIRIYARRGTGVW
jgi:hypothetical protein